MVHKNGSKESTPELGNGEPNKFIAKRPSVTKIEDRLVNFELKSSTSEPNENMGNGHAKKDLPKVDITKRREMFEKDMTPERAHRSSGDFSQATPLLSIKERLCNLERQKEEGNNSAIVANNRLSGDITSIKDRLKNLEMDNGQSMSAAAPKFDVPLGGSIKDRLSSLHSSVSTTTTMTVPGAVAEVSEQAASPKSVVVVGMAKKLQRTDTANEQVIEVETLKIEMEQIQIAAASTGSMFPQQPESLMTMDSIQDAVQEYVTIAQAVKLTGPPSIREKEEYREITDEDLFGGTDIEMDGDEDVEIDNLQQDMSVSSPTVTNSILINGSMESDSLEDVSQLQLVRPNERDVEVSKGGGAGRDKGQVIDTLAVLGNLLERSASNNNLAEQVGTKTRSSAPLVLPKPNYPTNSIPQSISDNSLVTRTTNNNTLKNNNDRVDKSQMKSSQSEFFDRKSGDRHCILLINNSPR